MNSKFILVLHCEGDMEYTENVANCLERVAAAIRHDALEGDKDSDKQEFGWIDIPTPIQDNSNPSCVEDLGWFGWMSEPSLDFHPMRTTAPVPFIPEALDETTLEPLGPTPAGSAFCISTGEDPKLFNVDAYKTPEGIRLYHRSERGVVGATYQGKKYVTEIGLDGWSGVLQPLPLLDVLAEIKNGQD